MIFRLAIRSLATRPIRTAVLACGFGFGIAVMAALLGVGAVILEQAHSPALEGGGDLLVKGRFGQIDSPRFVMTSVLGAPDMARRVVAASPSSETTLYLITGGSAVPVSARGGIPSLERAIGDPVIGNRVTGDGVSGDRLWVDSAADRAWTSPEPGELLRAMDRFHPIPALPEFAASWAEWLYFNGHTADGRLRFYLTFLVGPVSQTSRTSNTPAPQRVAGVRLQVDRDGRRTSYSSGGEVDAARLLQTAPDLDIGKNRVRLEGERYRIVLALPGAAGELTLDAAPGRSLPPATIRGARGWLSGYTAPVLSGTVRGTLTLGGERVTIENAAGYHDHNWGFWQGVHWQWGQVAHEDVSIVYGRVFPPADVADADRVPGFLGVLGPDGPLGFSTAVTIDDNPRRVVARGRAIDVTLVFTAEQSISTPMAMTKPASGPALDFLQLAGEYTVTGRVGTRELNFTARGAAETFRPH